MKATHSRLYWCNVALNLYKSTPESADMPNVSIIICVSTGWSSESFQPPSCVLSPPATQQITPLMRVSAGNPQLDPLWEHMLASSHFSNGLLSQRANITWYTLHNTSGGKSQSMSHNWSSIYNRLFINMLMPISTLSHNIVFTSWMVPIKRLLNFGDSSQQLPSSSETNIFSAK